MDPDDIETQKALDARIEQLQSELIDLKRRRNALSPISRLPTEILCKILLLIRQEEFKSGDKKIVPQYILLCHVSHFWRTTMLGCAEFWVDIRLVWSASWRASRMLSFMARHSGARKISVAYTHDRPSNHAHGPEIPIDLDLVRILHEESSKIKSLSLELEDFESSRDRGLEADVANIFSEGEFSNLEDFLFEIIPIGSEEPPILTLEKVFKNRPPKLQRLEVAGRRVCLESSRQQLKGLTHLILKGGLVGNLFELLSLSPGLKTLDVTGLQVTRSSSFPHPPNTSGHVSQLPHLESFVLSLDPDSLLNVLKGIQIPPNLTYLELGWVPFHNAREFFDAWERAQRGVIEPQHVLIGRLRRFAVGRPSVIWSILGWKTAEPPDQFKLQRINRSPLSVHLPFTLAPIPGSESPMINDEYLFDEPLEYEHKWSFGKVRVVEIAASAEENSAELKKNTLGNHFWTTIANAPYLQLLHLDSRFEDKFKETIITLGQDAFPALQYLIFLLVWNETDFRQISFHEFATSIVEYLKVDRRAPLALLGFRHCPEEANQDTLDALKEVAVNVVCRETAEWP
ncbi:hypothetical protein H1R20_g1051, partial [Candolleomyces eurysporus]